ncbi:MAG TPA: benzoate-CoA ligase family protein [Candidatus Dormibacteraeota bacterium]
MNASAALPEQLNLASRFVDSNVEQGRGDSVALITPGGPCTYSMLAARVNRIGNVLLALGVRAQQRVLLALSDSLDFVAAWYAAQKVGAVTAEVYTFLPAKDHAYYIDYTGATVVLVDGETMPRVREALELTTNQPLVLMAGPAAAQLRNGERSLEMLVATAAAELAPAPTTPDDIAIWKFTTGSTGQPKACVHPVRSAVVSHEAYARGVLDISADDVVLPVPKLFFGYARDLTALYPFGVGGTGIVFPERTTPQRIFELIAQHRPTILVNVPTMMQAMLDHPDAARQDLSCLRLCTSAGEALPEPLHRRWIERFGVPVLDGMGSSEAYHIFISGRRGRVRPGSMGEAVPGYDVDLVDDDGTTVDDGAVGRIRVRGDSIARMYWQESEKTARTFAPRTVLTGDLAVRDRDGFFWYRGRADDLLKVGGIWVAPTEVEACLAGHPDVSEAAVIGVEHAGLTLIRAFVVPRAGAHPTPEQLRAHVRTTLSGHKVPHDIDVVAALPRTGSGKVDRRALKAGASATAAPAT